MALRPRKRSLEIGMRVRHLLDNRPGIVVGSPEANGRRFLVPINIERSTRTELWPDHQIKIRPKREQFPAHGGTYQQCRRSFRHSK